MRGMCPLCHHKGTFPESVLAHTFRKVKRAEVKDEEFTNRAETMIIVRKHWLWEFGIIWDLKF